MVPVATATAVALLPCAVLRVNEAAYRQCLHTYRSQVYAAKMAFLRAMPTCTGLKTQVCAGKASDEARGGRR